MRKRGVIKINEMEVEIKKKKKKVYVYVSKSGIKNEIIIRGKKDDEQKNFSQRTLKLTHTLAFISRMSMERKTTRKIVGRERE